jgi:hypothetical protein
MYAIHQLIHEQQLAIQKYKKQAQQLLAEAKENNSRRGTRSAPIQKSNEEDAAIDLQGRRFAVMDCIFIRHPKRLIRSPESLRNENEKDLGLRYQDVLPESVGEQWSDARVSTIVGHQFPFLWMVY